METVRVLKSAGPSGETWELDESTDARFSVEGAAHTAGKGGVEIYPVQVQVAVSGMVCAYFEGKGYRCRHRYRGIRP